MLLGSAERMTSLAYALSATNTVITISLDLVLAIRPCQVDTEDDHTNGVVISFIIAITLF